MNDEIRALIDASAIAAATATRKEIETVVERLEGKIDLTVEALRLLDAKVDRRSAVIEERVRELTARIDVSVAQLADRLEPERIDRCRDAG